MSFEGVYEWFLEQGKYVLFSVAIVVALVCAFKRAWIALLGSVVALAFLGIFVADPEAILSLSDFFKEKLSIGD